MEKEKYFILQTKYTLLIEIFLKVLLYCHLELFLPSCETTDCKDMLPHGFSYTVENEEATPYLISKNPAFLFSLCPLQIGQHHHCHTCANYTHICPPSSSLTADLYTRIPNYLPGALTAGFYQDLEFNMSLQTALVCSLPQV